MRDYCFTGTPDFVNSSLAALSAEEKITTESYGAPRRITSTGRVIRTLKQTKEMKLKHPPETDL